MFRKALASKSDCGLYPYGQLGQSLSHALRQTSSCRHSSYVIEASIFFVGSSMFSSAALTAPKPNAPIPDFSNRASFDIQYACATRSFESKFFWSSSSQGKVAGFQFWAKDRSKALNICWFVTVQFPGKMLRSSFGRLFLSLPGTVFQLSRLRSLLLKRETPRMFCVSFS